MNTKSDGAEVRAFQVGDRVRATHKPEHDREYDIGFAFDRKLRSGSPGTITDRSDSHGVCFRVEHDNAGPAWWEPDELTLLPPEVRAVEVTDAEIAEVLQQDAIMRRPDVGWTEGQAAWKRLGEIGRETAPRMARELQALRADVALLQDGHVQLLKQAREHLEHERHARIEAERRENEARTDLGQERQARIAADERVTALSRELLKREAEGDDLRARLAAFTALAGIDPPQASNACQWCRRPFAKGMCEQHVIGIVGVPGVMVICPSCDAAWSAVARGALFRDAAEQKLARVVSLAQALFVAQRGDRSIAAYEASEALRKYVEAIAGDVQPTPNETAAVALLRDIEWCNTGGERRCPWCGGALDADAKRVAHASDCRLVAVLAGDVRPMLTEERAREMAAEILRAETQNGLVVVLGSTICATVARALLRVSRGDYGPAREPSRMAQAACAALIESDGAAYDSAPKMPEPLTRDQAEVWAEHLDDRCMALSSTAKGVLVEALMAAARGETEPR